MQYPLQNQPAYDCAFCNFSTQDLLAFENHSLELHFPKPLPSCPTLPSGSDAEQAQRKGGGKQRQGGGGQGNRGKACQGKKWWREFNGEWEKEEHGKDEDLFGDTTLQDDLDLLAALEDVTMGQSEGETSMFACPVCDTLLDHAAMNKHLDTCLA